MCLLNAVGPPEDTSFLNVCHLTPPAARSLPSQSFTQLQFTTLQPTIRHNNCISLTNFLPSISVCLLTCVVLFYFVVSVSQTCTATATAVVAYPNARLKCFSNNIFCCVWKVLPFAVERQLFIQRFVLCRQTKCCNSNDDNKVSRVPDLVVRVAITAKWWRLHT